MRKKRNWESILSFDNYLSHMGIKHHFGLSAHLHCLPHHIPSSSKWVHWSPIDAC